MFPFGKPGKSSGAPHSRHLAVVEKPGKSSGPAAGHGANASLAESMQLRDVDPVHSFTSTEHLREQNAKYVQLWPSDIPHKRR